MAALALGAGQCLLAVQKPCWHAFSLQAFFNFLLTSYYLYITMRRAPMHRTWLNCAHSFMALFPWWAASLAFIGVFYPQASVAAWWKMQ